MPPLVFLIFGSSLSIKHMGVHKFFPVMLKTPQKLMKSFHIDPGGQRLIGSSQSVASFHSDHKSPPSSTGQLQSAISAGLVFLHPAFSPCPTVCVSFIDWQFLQSFVFGGALKEKAHEFFTFLVYLLRSVNKMAVQMLLLSFHRASVCPFLASCWNIWSKCQVFPFPLQTKATY